MSVMNQSAIMLGLGGVLLGGVGGFVIGGKSGGSGASEQNLSDSKTNRAKVVAVDAGRDKVVRSFDEIYDEPGQTARVQKMLDFYANLDPALFEVEARKLDELPFSQRILASFLLFSQWAEIDPLNALEHSDTMGRAGFFVKPTVLQSWASVNPQAAAEFLEENPGDFASSRMMGGRRGQGPASTIASEWARQDPDAAFAWAQGLEGRQASEAVANVIKEIASDDPVAALAMANGLDDDGKSAAYDSIALEWGRENWSEMEAWANTLPAEQRDAALAQGVEGLSQRDGEAAAAKLLTISEGQARDQVFDDVIENWAQNDPVAAMDFLLANGSEAAQENAIGEAMGPLTRTNPGEALEVIRSLDDNSVRDRAVSSYVFSAQDTDPQETITLAATIGDEDRRERSVGMAAGRWLLEDEAAANRFFESTDLIEPSTLERIQNRVNGQGGGGGFRGGFRGGRGR